MPNKDGKPSQEQKPKAPAQQQPPKEEKKPQFPPNEIYRDYTTVPTQKR